MYISDTMSSIVAQYVYLQKLIWASSPQMSNGMDGNYEYDAHRKNTYRSDPT